MSDAELKPCPFCGGNRIITFKTAKNRGYATCIECGARTRGCGNYEHKDGLRWKERAVRLWNTRKPVERIVEQLEDMIDSNVDMDTGENCNNWVVDMQNSVIEQCAKIVLKGGVE